MFICWRFKTLKIEENSIESLWDGHFLKRTSLQDGQLSLGRFDWCSLKSNKNSINRVDISLRRTEIFAPVVSVFYRDSTAYKMNEIFKMWQHSQLYLYYHHKMKQVERYKICSTLYLFLHHPKANREIQ